MSNLSDKIVIDKYNDALNEIQEYAICYYKELTNSLPRYGARLEDHCKAIEESIKNIVGEVKFGHDDDFSCICWFILGAVSWIHPINSFSIEQPIKNQFYDQIELIIKNKGIEINALVLIKGIVDFSRTDLSKCPVQNINAKTFYGNLLGAYFHIAYKFHINEIYFNENFGINHLCEIFIKDDEGISRDLKIQWLKTIFIQQIIPNRDKKIVEIYLKLPPGWNSKKDNEELKNDILIHLISKDIKETLDGIKDIFILSSDKQKGGAVEHSHFNNIFVDIEFIEKEMDEKDKGRFKLGNEEVDRLFFKQILFNAALLIYPNASKLIDISIENIKRISSPIVRTNKEKANKKESLKEFQTFLDKLISTRPCHAGLLIIKDIIDVQIKNLDSGNSDLEKVMERIKDKIEYLYKIRKESFDRLVKSSVPLFLDGGNILLYGNSDTVTEILKKIVSIKDLNDRINIFISECRNKTKYNYNNSFLYCDAIEYAKKIENIGFKNIYIVSEAVLGNLLERDDFISKVCFGANGIDLQTGDCAHTVGHLMISQLAHMNSIPVYVFADTIKFYNLKDKNQEGKRVNHWLASETIINKELQKRIGARVMTRNIDVQKYNLREDRVPPKLITFYITDEGFIPSNQLGKFLNRREKEIEMIIKS